VNDGTKQEPFEQTYFVEFDSDETFQLSNNLEDEEPIVDFYIGPNKPCLDANDAYWKERKGLDKTFKEPDDCSSEFEGS